VGYRCPDCVRELQDKFYNATSGDIIKGLMAAFAGGILAGAAIFLLILFLGGFLFFGFLAAFFLGPALGGVVAEITRRAMGKRRARNFSIFGDIALLIGILIIILPLGILMWSPLPLGMAALAVILAASTFYARLKF
jgi:MFS family permease